MEQVLIDQEGGHEGLGLGEGEAVAFGELLGGEPLAAADELVEVGGGDDRQVGRVGRLADLAAGEAGVAPDGHERGDLAPAAASSSRWR